MGLVVLTTLFTLVVMANAESSTSAKEFYDVAEAPKHFEEFIKKHERQYKDDADRELHYQAFKENLQKINELNKKNPSATYGINKFADYTEEDRKSMFGFKKP